MLSRKRDGRGRKERKEGRRKWERSVVYKKGHEREAGYMEKQSAVRSVPGNSLYCWLKFFFKTGNGEQGGRGGGQLRERRHSRCLLLAHTRHQKLDCGCCGWVGG